MEGMRGRRYEMIRSPRNPGQDKIERINSHCRPNILDISRRGVVCVSFSLSPNIWEVCRVMEMMSFPLFDFDDDLSVNFTSRVLYLFEDASVRGFGTEYGHAGREE